MRVLVVGAGGREHALAWKIAQSPLVKKVYCAPGNAGTASVAENVEISADNINALRQFAMMKGIGLTVVGPEQPLVKGIVDSFEESGLRVFGPSQRAAEIEGSKVFCKDLMKKYGIPTARYEVFNSPDKVKLFTREDEPVVVKASGLAAGKGVILCNNGTEARSAIESIMRDRTFGEAGDQVVVEEFLTGQEVSLLAFTDGKTVLSLDSAQDHKAAFEGDTGPNTGGMGAYSPAPVFTDDLKGQVMNEIMNPTVRAMAKEGRQYRGILYAGLMLTESGPKVLEFNARFGDPETQPILMRIDNDIVPVFEACIDGTLAKCSLQWKPEPTVCVVMAAKGYPGVYEKGKEISGLDSAGNQEGTVVFHAGTRMDKGRVVTNGGRILGVTALGTDLGAAIKKAYSAVDKIEWDGIHYRKDIGKKAF
ncbi:MAG: phosphoribosylamine--glycine ligase [Nitrospinaceae bacterium]|jgi:phosphoribosylamine--glycine ligase|nr:phosphoribosylamine--glycine ligase [Nitrospinaceae bacterium]MDP6657553.1 phosphoribosylamine--glycine ligase [Nitrospinaceae bacterium]MDP6712894.1 phosphoribosylamine--glycine ligase [Nitrospinaceae bacterium]MDP7057850.1 phosphoribosylamine--glycine ligase [Nitrospinaceae bacterium]HAK37161.1 phosphoribosylamine--glycine ligase [Nitrospina sp.]|tara:strand:- start:1016 stop:2278 length:1263 start_codon:yes stop_codon:yes gene_type:complete